MLSRLSLLTLLLVVLIAPLGPGAMGQLPLRQDQASEEPRERLGFFARTVLEIRQAQGRLHRQLAGTVREIKQGGGLGAVIALMTFSFLYGVFHAAGPGHGKVVISSYLLTHDSRIRNGVLISFAAAAVQAVSAVLLVGVLALALSLPQLEVTGQVRTLELASYALIVALGLWMLYGAATGRGCGHAHDDHDHDHSHDHEKTLGQRLGRIPGLILAIGIRPCSGAVIVLLFALANDLLAVGIVATFAMAVGTGLTVSILGIASVFGNKLTRLLGSSSERWEQRLRNGLAIAGSLFITAIGATLFLVTYTTPAGPLL